MIIKLLILIYNFTYLLLYAIDRIRLHDFGLVLVFQLLMLLGSLYWVKKDKLFLPVIITYNLLGLFFVIHDAVIVKVISLFENPYFSLKIDIGFIIPILLILIYLVIIRNQIRSLFLTASRKSELES